MEKLREYLDKTLPRSKYSNGKDAKCILYRICNVFDIVDD